LTVSKQVFTPARLAQSSLESIFGDRSIWRA
jgi:hypothetical protein